jgi:hypothetical protein
LCDCVRAVKKVAANPVPNAFSPVVPRGINEQNLAELCVGELDRQGGAFGDASASLGGIGFMSAAFFGAPTMPRTTNLM